MDAAAEIGRNPVSAIFSLSIDMSSLRRDGNPSREIKFSGANGDWEIFIFPVQLTTTRIGNLIHHLYLYSSYLSPGYLVPPPAPPPLLPCYDTL